ncbi:RNA ligase/cyclic nucleotide phosphodiesterase [Aspergillus cavernicola]|uniref:RNA ligase/cyclic nucleotide phosphodiesterase n=1 Tax=Aspergillus cavernicola TaxID=176166 RepID=A0ABR4IYN8_9EURO
MTLSTTDASLATINPFDQLLIDCQNDPKQIQSRYETHRSNRNTQQKGKLLHQDFQGWQIDEILAKLVAQSTDVNEHPFSDHRHNLNLYARPPKHIRELVAEIQQEIRDVVPNLWFSPPESLHITTLEIANSRTKAEIDNLATQLKESGLAERLVDYTNHTSAANTIGHRARLVKPVLSYDASAMALSFLPAAGEPSSIGRKTSKQLEDDAYTYHHLRRDLATRVLETGFEMGARYIVPSAHVTIARFVSPEGDVDREHVAGLVERIERVNGMLRERYWPDLEVGRMSDKGEWVVGQEEGLEFNKGTSWYGGGERVLVGRGFE